MGIRREARIVTVAGAPAGAIPRNSAVDVFAELAQRAPADVAFRFVRIEISRDKLHLQGTTDAAENVDRIVSALHVHLDAHNCLEVLVVRGAVREIRQIAHELIGVKGVKHGKLVMTTTAENL